MGRLPVISGKDAVRRFEKIGYQFIRQTGSHMRLKHLGDPSREPLSIPDHKELRKGLLLRLLRDAHVIPLRIQNVMNLSNRELVFLGLRECYAVRDEVAVDEK